MMDQLAEPAIDQMTEVVIMVIMDVNLQDLTDHLDTFLQQEADEKQQQKRRRILLAATDLFVAHGYRKTSVDEVARAAGIAKGTVYLYYRNKAELFVHAIALEKQGYLKEIAPIGDPSLLPLDRLRAFIVLGLILSHNMPLTARIAKDHEIGLVLQDVDQQVLAETSELQIAFTAGLIGAAADQTWPDETLENRARVLLDLMFAVVTSGQFIHIGMSVEEYAHLLADVIVEGIVHEPQGWVTFQMGASDQNKVQATGPQHKRSA